MLIIFQLISWFQCIAAKAADDPTNFIGFHQAAPMPFARSDMTATTYHQAGDLTRIYLVGGCVSNQICDPQTFFCLCPAITNKCSYYTPETDQWNSCPDAPIARYRHQAALVNGVLILVGGRHLNDSIVTQVDEFSLLTNTWTTHCHWPDATSDGVAFAYKDTFYSVGGYDVSYNMIGSISALNVTSMTWDNTLPPMKQPRGDVGLGDIPGSTFYILGGFHQNCNTTRSVEIFDADTRTWSSAPNSPIGRSDMAVGTMGSSIFAIGGEITNEACDRSVPVKSVSRYDPATEIWKEEQSISLDLFRFTGASYNGSLSPYSRAIYLFGGQGTFDSTCSCYPIKSSTLKYIPASTVKNAPKAISAKGIAGIVIVGVVVGGSIAMAITAWCCVQMGYIVIDADPDAWNYTSTTTVRKQSLNKVIPFSNINTAASDKSQGGDFGCIQLQRQEHKGDSEYGGTLGGIQIV